MKDALLEMGFCVSEKNEDFVEKDFGKFSVSFCLSGSFFWLATDMSAYREEVPYSFLGIEKFKALIKANEEYFK